MPADPIQVAPAVAEVLERCGLRYLVGGSLSSSLSGEPRSTLDVDLVQTELDEGYLRDGARRLGVLDLLDRAMLEAGRS